MAFHRPQEAQKQLEKDVKKVITLAARKVGATSKEIQEALECTIKDYRYQNVLAHARKSGLKSEGAGRAVVYRAPKR